MSGPDPKHRPQPFPDRYRNEPMALAARSDTVLQVDIGHVDAETFDQAREWNETIRGMAGMAVRNDDGDVLFIHHEDYGGWVFPGGIVESGESFQTAAVRETSEESGVEATVVRPLLVRQFVPRHDDRSTDNFFVLFEGRATETATANPAQLGLADESIVDTTWTKTAPSPIPDDRTVQATIDVVVDRFEELDRQTTEQNGKRQ